MVKNPLANAGVTRDGPVPGSRRSPGGGNGPTPVFLYEKFHGRGAWWAIVHGVTRSQTQLRKGQQDEMVGWHHRLNGHEFEQAPGVGDGQGSLACCSPGGCKESDTIKRLN